MLERYGVMVNLLPPPPFAFKQEMFSKDQRPTSGMRSWVEINAGACPPGSAAIRAARNARNVTALRARLLGSRERSDDQPPHDANAALRSNMFAPRRTRSDLAALDLRCLRSS